MIDVIVFWTVYEDDHIGILLDGTRLTQVGELGTLAVETFAAFHTTVQLTEGKDGDVELLGQALERAGDGGYLFLTRGEAHAVGVHQLQIVDHDELDAMFAHQSAGLGTQFEDGEARCVVDIERGAEEVVNVFVETVPLVALQLAVEDLRALDLTDVGDEAVDELDVRHFQ